MNIRWELIGEEIYSEHDLTQLKGMKDREIKYKDVIDLGFIREEESDNGHFNEYGYQWVIVSRVLWTNKKETVTAEWDIVDRTVQVVRFKEKSGKIISRIDINTLSELKAIVRGYEIFSEAK